ncbi:MAG: hypothetical protein AAF560_13195 [Acidobacteriota bacterium]
MICLCWLAASLSGSASSLAEEPPGGASSELWRAPSGAPCRAELIQRLGGVRVSAAPSGTPWIVSGPSNLRLAASTQTTSVALTIEAASKPSEQADQDVEIALPEGCELAIRTEHGAVHVDLGGRAAPISVDTVSGEIAVTVAPDVEATIALATSGMITVDFTISINHRYHEEPAKHGQIVLGDGATQMRLTSLRGNVSVLRLWAR